MGIRSAVGFDFGPFSKRLFDFDQDLKIFRDSEIEERQRRPISSSLWSKTGLKPQLKFQLAERKD